MRSRDVRRVRELLRHALECLDYICPQTPDEECMVCEIGRSLDEALRLLGEDHD